jgi:hypothetical protein
MPWLISSQGEHKLSICLYVGFLFSDVPSQFFLDDNTWHSENLPKAYLHTCSMTGMFLQKAGNPSD